MRQSDKKTLAFEYEFSFSVEHSFLTITSISFIYFHVQVHSEESPQHRRRIPSLRSFLDSPVKQVTMTPIVGHSILVIKPCAVVLHRLPEVSHDQVIVGKGKLCGKGTMNFG